MHNLLIRVLGMLMGLMLGGVLSGLLLGLVLPAGTGELLFATTVGTQLELHRLDIDRQVAVRLTFNQHNDWQGRWSPDGTRIVFTRNDDGNTDLYLMDGDGRHSQRLTYSNASDFSPAWSPDGEWITFVSDRQGTIDLYIITPEGQAERRLTDGSFTVVAPAWSPDGTSITFVGDYGPGSDYDVLALELASGDIRVLASTPADELSPSWSPDGRYLTYTSNFNNLALFLADQVTRQVVPLYSNNFIGNDTPSWSPDGRYLTFIAQPNGFPDIYLLEAGCYTQQNPCTFGLRVLSRRLDSEYYSTPYWRP
jgi:TolB protein